MKAVDGVSFEIRKGRSLGVVGESGSGKSTLALALLRLIKSEGSIQFGDVSLNSLNQQQITPIRKEMQIVFQDPYGSLSPRMNVLSSSLQTMSYSLVKISSKVDRKSVV